MPLQKQPISIPFTQGVDTKTDPLQVPLGKFLALDNSSFDKSGSLTKRNGFASLPALPDNSSAFVTTFNGNLTAIGQDLKAFSDGADLWVRKGIIQPLQLSTLPLIRNSTNQSQCDSAIAPNGLICTVYTDNVPTGSSTLAIYKYVIADSVTGQNILSPAPLVSNIGTVSYFPRVFSLSNYFVMVYPIITGSTTALQYATINSRSPQAVSSSSTLSTNFSYAFSDIGSVSPFDAVVANNSLFVSWNGASNTGIKAISLNSFLAKSSVVTIATTSGTIFSVTADITGNTPNIWTSVYSCGSHTGSVVATDMSLNPIFSAQQFSSVGSVSNLASAASGGIDHIYWERNNWYSYDPSGLASNIINRTDVFQTGSVGATNTIVRSLGIASKAFLIGSVSYVLGAYGSSFQSTYFLINSTGQVAAKLAYGNGVGYVKTGPPLVNVNGSTAAVAYLIKDLIQSVNKDTGIGSTTPSAAIYSQTGINLVNFTFGAQGLVTSEIGNDLHVNGGFLWMYDGYKPVEHLFHVCPEDVVVTLAGNTGSLTSQTYFYRATYEWSDNQGNVFRSAPSIPVSFIVGSTSSGAKVNIPTLRLTYKIDNPVKIVLYRWSETQQVYYQVTSIQTPVINSTTIDSVVYTDGASDASILGNNILYTNGGVVENIAAPACSAITQFDTRLWMIDSEDPNLLWYSKQVIETVPVETSDLFTVYVSPSEGAQGSTGPMKCLAPMDDKLIIFKKNAIYYINGKGPDNTGANSQYSEPTFVTATVGCDNQDSIVFMPNGLMFQSDKGIWLLGRDLSTQYIGAPVEAYNNDEVLSSLTIPGTNQVRFTLNSSITLVYDYYFNQWGTYSGIPGISSALYQNLHTFINSSGKVFQESPGLYVDGSNPVLMSFTTGWANLAGLQGYQRAYQLYLLGLFQSPHRFSVGIAYDFDANVNQLVNITPDNYSGTWGSGSSWGASSVWGGPAAREQWQINFQRQQCQSFQLSFNEYFDASKGAMPGAGVFLSGMDLVVGLKRGYPRNISSKNRKS